MPNYISWSQYQLWNKSKKQYIEKYFEGSEQFVTKEMIFGKKVHEMIETGSRNVLPFDIDLFDGKAEHNILVPITKSFLLRSIVDYISPDREIYEWKTGKTPWTQEKAEEHGQLYFEYMAMQEAGLNPSDTAYLVWIETRNNESGEIELTGRTETFKVKIDKKQLDHWKKQMKETRKNIEEAFEQWLEWFEDERVNQYVELQKQIDELQEQQKQLLAEVREDVLSGKYVQSPVGKFYKRTNTKKVVSVPEDHEVYHGLLWKEEQLENTINQKISEMKEAQELKELHTKKEEIEAEYTEAITSDNVFFKANK